MRIITKVGIYSRLRTYLPFFMQLFALDLNKNLLNARQARKQIDYFCLECNQVVRLRGGPYRQPHFYHLDPTPFCRQHQKGLIHLQLQSYFFQLLPNGDCKLEYRISEVNRIADVAWLSKKIIFEIQYSPISAEEVTQRNKDYEKCGWTVIWILHDHRFNQFRLSPAEKVLRSSPHYFSNMDQFGQGMIYDQYDHVEKGMRKVCLAPLPILPLYIAEVPSSEESSINLLKRRTKSWPLAFEGDLLSLFQKNPDSEYFKKALEIEKRFSQQANRFFYKNFFQFFWEGLKRGYNIFFRTLLEKACR